MYEGEKDTGFLAELVVVLAKQELDAVILEVSKASSGRGDTPATEWEQLRHRLSSRAWYPASRAASGRSEPPGV
jgi:hypothetical protein